MAKTPMEFEEKYISPPFQLGTSVDLKSYTDVNKYTFPYNGYVYVRANASSANTIMYNYGYTSVPANTYQTLWVRKGGMGYIAGPTPQIAWYYPDISEA